MRGLKVVSIALGSVTLPEEDAEMIKQAQRTAIMKDPTMAAATLVGAQADAMKAAASNEAGAMTGFMGMGMARNAGGGMNAQNLFAMGQQQQRQAAPAPRTGSRRLEMLMRSDRERQILPELRHKEARTRSGGRLEMQMRRNCHGQILPRVRLAEACRHRRLAVLLRHSQQRQILLELRR